jgi:hypothetical protein
MTDHHITIIATLIALVLGVTLHEAAHGYLLSYLGITQQNKRVG